MVVRLSHTVYMCILIHIYTHVVILHNAYWIHLDHTYRTSKTHAENQASTESKVSDSMQDWRLVKKSYLASENKGSCIYSMARSTQCWVSRAQTGQATAKTWSTQRWVSRRETSQATTKMWSTQRWVSRRGTSKASSNEHSPAWMTRSRKSLSTCWKGKENPCEAIISPRTLIFHAHFATLTSPGCSAFQQCLSAQAHPNQALVVLVVIFE